MSRWQRAAAWCGLGVLSLAVYWQGFGAWFRGDDFAWLALPLRFQSFFAPMAQGTIRPLSDRLFFIAGFGLFGLHALPFHLLAFATQLANLVLVVWIGERLTNRAAAGFLAAALWTVSDTAVLPLAWASAYNQVLCGFFLLLAFHFLLRYVKTGEERYHLAQWAAFLLGFGAMELNVVYPALAAAYTFLCARSYFRRTWLLFLPSLAYFAIHQAAAPAGRDPAYRLHFTGAMLRTLGKYWAWTVGPWDFWAPFAAPRWILPALMAVISIGLLAFAAKRGRLALFFLAWFAIAIAPVLPLRDHMTEYYSFLPAIGLCWLGGWALAEARPAALALAAVYLAIMLPRTVAAGEFNARLSGRVRGLVESVARAHELHPTQTILLDGVDSDLFYHAVVEHPFRLLGIDQVYLTPGSAGRIDPHPELGDAAGFELPEEETAEGLDRDGVAVYDVRGPVLRNITSAYANAPRVVELPRRVDVANPLAASLLGPEWYAPEGDHRWMGKRASLRMAGPSAAGQKLYLRGVCPPGQLRAGSLGVSVTVDGTLLPTAVAASGEFELAFALPAAEIGRPAIQVVVEVSRTFRAGADIRDLGVAFGEFEVR